MTCIKQYMSVWVEMFILAEIRITEYFQNFDHTNSGCSDYKVYVVHVVYTVINSHQECDFPTEHKLFVASFFNMFKSVF